MTIKIEGWGGLIRSRLAIPLLALSIALGGCAGTAQFVVATAQSLSSKIPSQAATLADAAIATKIVEDLATAWVGTVNDMATLDEIEALVDRLHFTLKNLETANAAGQSLALAIYNEALSALRSYTASKGI